MKKSNNGFTYFSFPGIVVINPLSADYQIATNHPIMQGELVQTESGMVVHAQNLSHIEVLTTTGAKVLKPVRDIKKFFLR
jgi:hypothetical protein